MSIRRWSLHRPAAIRAATAITVLSSITLATPTSAQGQVAEHREGEIEGVVVDADDGQTLAGAQVSILGLRQRATSHGDGSFHLPVALPGNYLITVDRLGYGTEAVLVSLGEESAYLTIRLTATPFDIPGLVVTGALSERESQDVLRPVDVLRGDELQRQLESSVASTLRAQPGMSATSIGPATARPVIRGLSGDRVLMLEDGARVGDVSNAGADHATAVDPSSARRIEVVRGPAALLYGSNALGGVINVIRDEVPSMIPHHVTGSASVQTQTVSNSYAGSADLLVPLTEHVPLRFEASGREAGDLATPLGSLENTEIQTWSASAGTAYVGDWGYLGGAFRAYRNDYGIPGDDGDHAEGVLIEMERTSAKLQGELERGAGPFSSLEVDATFTSYEHREIEPPEDPETAFELQTLSGDLLARHDGLGPFSSGAVGVRGSFEDFGFGGEVDTPDAKRYSAAAYLFEEIDLDPVRIEAGVRYDWVRVDPVEEDPSAAIGPIRQRTFDAASGSLGLLYDVGNDVTLGASVARAFRTPDVIELFSSGAHLAAYAFEQGNPSLGTETGTGVDVFVRWGGASIDAELTGFYNSITGYVFGEETGEVEPEEGLAVYQYQGQDARLVGFEGRVDWTLLGDVVAHGSVSYVRGTLEDNDAPLPLMPPLHGIVGLEYSPRSWFVRGEAELAARQERLGAFETVTDGYTVFNVSAGLRVTLAGRLNVITLTLANFTDVEYRNHLSRVKELMPEAGRGVSLGYRVVF